MWRIGQLARMAGVSDRTLRHYDKIGLLKPAAVDRATGYRWYGTAELAKLERIRGLQRLGLSLRQVADLVDAPDAQLRQALNETIAALRRDIATMSAAVAAAEDHLAVETSILPQRTTVGTRHLRVHYMRIGHPSELNARCSTPTTLLTWLNEHPTGSFLAAHTTDRGGDSLTLSARNVVRAVVPPACGVVRAGQELFGWLRRQDLAITGPTLEEHLVDADGARVTVLEIPVHPAEATPPHNTSAPDRSQVLEALRLGQAPQSRTFV